MSKARQPRDSGMTLPEVLISVLMTGLLVATISMSITVLYRQSDNTSGRANNARSEQNVNVWMPTDLASAETVDTSPGASPCAPTCPPGGDIGGTNALMLSWSGTVPGAGGVAVPTMTKVSYRYVLVGSEYQMIRVECVSVDSALPTCRANTVLHDLDPPPISANYIVGQTPPTWIMVVSQALDPADTTGSTPIPSDDPTFKNKNGQRVVVTINGGGDVAGAGGGKNQISLSAGGTERSSDLATNSVSFNQALTAARTRCGGNFGLLVDTSLSISSADMATGRTAIAGTGGLIDTFAGTPVKLQVDKFSYRGQNLGAGATGSRYFDMLKESDVADLKAYISGGALSTGGTATAIVPDGSTNWEDALYRMFRNSDGTIQANLPSKVIFFTDGVPTYDRLVTGSQPGTTALPAPTQNPDDTGLAAPSGSTYNQRGWNRANRIAREFGVQVDFIGVFVGADTTASSNWTDVNAGYHLTNWQKGYHDVWERAYHDTYQRGNNVVYQRGYHTDYQRGNNVSWQHGYHTDYQRGNNVSWQRGYHLDYQRGNNVSWQYAKSGVAFEKWNGSAWVSETDITYLSQNTAPGSGDNHRIRVTGTPSNWTTMTLAQYNQSNSAAGPSEGVRTSTSGSATPWTSITLADYNLNNTTPSDASDGFQIVNAYSSPYDLWGTATQSAYNTGNTTSASTDGWKTIVTGSATSWTSITLADYNLSNTTPSDATDGFQTANAYTSPYDFWETATQTAYNTGNTTSASTDGWKTIVTGSATSWTSITSSDYNLSNTTASDATDGFQIVNLYSSPFSSWENSTQAAYDPANTTVDSSDGWRTTTSGSRHALDNRDGSSVQRQQHDHRRNRRLADRQDLQLAVRHVGDHHAGNVQQQQQHVRRERRVPHLPGVHVAVQLVGEHRRSDLHRPQDSRPRPHQHERWLDRNQGLRTPVHGLRRHPNLQQGQPRNPRRVDRSCRPGGPDQGCRWQCDQRRARQHVFEHQLVRRARCLEGDRPGPVWWHLDAANPCRWHDPRKRHLHVHQHDRQHQGGDQRLEAQRNLRLCHPVRWHDHD